MVDMDDLSNFQIDWGDPEKNELSKKIYQIGKDLENFLNKKKEKKIDLPLGFIIYKTLRIPQDSNPPVK